MLQKKSMDDSMLTKSIRGLASSGSSDVMGGHQGRAPMSPQNSSINYSGYLFKRSNRPYEEKKQPSGLNLHILGGIGDINRSSSWQMQLDESTHSHSHSHTSQSQSHTTTPFNPLNAASQLDGTDFMDGMYPSRDTPKPFGIPLDDDDDDDDNDDLIVPRINLKPSLSPSSLPLPTITTSTSPSSSTPMMKQSQSQSTATSSTTTESEEPPTTHTLTPNPTHQALHLLSSFFGGGRPASRPAALTKSKPQMPKSVQNYHGINSQNTSSSVDANEYVDVDVDVDASRQSAALTLEPRNNISSQHTITTTTISTTKPKSILKSRSTKPPLSSAMKISKPPKRSQPIAITPSGSGDQTDQHQQQHRQQQQQPLDLKIRPSQHGPGDDDMKNIHPYDDDHDNDDDEEEEDSMLFFPSQPEDYTDPVDGHRWRAKFCVLTDGVLYFYPNAKIGNSKAAERERNRLSHDQQQQQQEDNDNGASNSNNNAGNSSRTTTTYHGGKRKGNRNGNKAMNMMDADDHLAKSPMPRSLHPMLSAKEKNGGGSFCYDPNVYWEKRVALNMVGAVRSSPDFGEKAFELIAMSSTSNNNSNLDETGNPIHTNNSEDGDADGAGGGSEEVDRLILRADTAHDVNCWIFEIHKSFVILMKQLATFVGSHSNDTLKKKENYRHSSFDYGAAMAIPAAQSKSYVPNTSQWGAVVARNSAQNAIAPMSPAEIMSSSFAASNLLSSSLAQAGFRRQKSVRGRSDIISSPASTPGGGSSPIGPSPSPSPSRPFGGIMRSKSDEKIFRSDFIMPPSSFPLAKLPTTRSSLRLDVQDTEEEDVKDGIVDEEKKNHTNKVPQPSPPIQTQKVEEPIVRVTPSPPLVNNNEPKILIPPSTGKYVPPHLRGGSGKKYVPPHLRKNNAGLEQNISPITSFKKKQLEPSPPTTNKVSPLGGNGENNFKPIQDSVSEILDQVRSEDREFEYLHSNGFGQADKEEEEEEGPVTPVESDSSSSEDHEDAIMVKLGGCADPLLVVGSICDPMYKPISASKVGKAHAPAYGYYSDDYELGAVSRCGVRDKNEDAYVVLNDLLQKPLGMGTESDYAIDMKESYFTRFKTHGLYAIFDGHCGNQAARFAAEKFHSILLDESCNYDDMEDDERDDDLILREILNASIERLDEEFCEFCIHDGRDWYSGSTAIVALMVDDKIAVASVGDASGVLSSSSRNIDLAVMNGWSVLEEHDEDLNKLGGSKGGIVYREVAESHCPSRPAERERIQAANGWVTHETEIPIISQFQRMNWSDQDVLDIFHRCFSDRFSDSHGKPARILDIYRVCGDLAVSRAIGDREYKAAFNRDPALQDDQMDAGNNEWRSPAPMPFHTYQEIHKEEHTGIFEGDLVIATPSIQFFQVGSYGDDEFLVIACDGLWDVIDPDDAVRVTRNLIFVLGFSTKECAERLAELAGGLGSSDNITVIVVRFYGKSSGLS